MDERPSICDVCGLAKSDDESSLSEEENQSEPDTQSEPDNQSEAENQSEPDDQSEEENKEVDEKEQFQNECRQLWLTLNRNGLELKKMTATQQKLEKDLESVERLTEMGRFIKDRLEQESHNNI
ncbi:uncharacterized protein [Drosophila pseudoobscura]|uniref:Uncharacterized protein n=1 Tax=Drosophila pseudoobscura pseudoobscura TaxID=46245 RepID=A0A6I8W891_DROPS|nr:uncharacterized protein LOC117184593 [Drosophila pseudoobscura]